MDLRVFWISVIIILHSLITLANALPSTGDHNVATSQAPPSGNRAPPIVQSVAEMDATVNTSAATRTPITETSLKTETTGTKIQKTVSFSSQISEVLGGSESASFLESDEILDTSESISADSARDVSSILHRQTSFEPSGKVEEEFVKHFDTWQFPGAERSIFWKAMRIIYLSSAEEMHKICQSIHSVYHNSHLSTSPKILSYALRISILDLGPKGTTSFWIDVLTCEPEGSDIIHVTKGTRPNSVYFVEPAVIWDRADDFVLDKDFESDVDLEYSFKDAIKLTSGKQLDGDASASSSILEMAYDDRQTSENLESPVEDLNKFSPNPVDISSSKIGV